MMSGQLRGFLLLPSLVPRLATPIPPASSATCQHFMALKKAAATTCNSINFFAGKRRHDTIELFEIVVGTCIANDGNNIS